jgi:hypothetical protein
MSFLPELKRQARKANISKRPRQMLELNTFGFSSDTPVGALLEAYREIIAMTPPSDADEHILFFNAFREAVTDNPKLFEAPEDEEGDDSVADYEDEFTWDDDLDTGGGFDTGPSGGDYDLEDDGQSSFEEEYPEEDADTILETLYEDWLAQVRNKPFVKTIRGYHDVQQRGGLNILDREFLWRLIKAISSCITHVVIEAEQRVESIILVQTYYDGLVGCMNTVVHAADQEDVMRSFQYMVDFLGISKEGAPQENAPAEDEF